MTTINTNYTVPRINGDVEPNETAASSTGKADALSDIANDDRGVGRTRDALQRSFILTEPDGNSPTGDLNAIAQRIANLSNSVQADVFAFMSLFFQMALETRKTSSEIRTAEREAKFQELQSAADKIRDAGIIQMVAGIVGGAAAIGAGALNVGGGSKANLALKNNTTVNPQMATSLSQNIGMKFGGIASQVQGAGQIGSSTINVGASVAQTEQKEHETQAEKDQAQVDTANELYQNMQQTIQDVLSRLAAIQQSNSDTVKQIVRA